MILSLPVNPRPGPTPLQGVGRSRCWLNLRWKKCASVAVRALEGGGGEGGSPERESRRGVLGRCGLSFQLPTRPQGGPGPPGHRGRQPGLSPLCGRPLGRDKEEEEASVELRSPRSRE